MVSREHARRLALALPESVEQDHHGRPSFRVAGKIFATQWDAEHMNVMLDEGSILTAIEADAAVYEPVYRRKRLAGGARRSSPRRSAPFASALRARRSRS
jgi:hypothetical protein